MFKRSLSVTLILWLFYGCVDSNYDLSDIDTNVQVRVKDLVVPINLSPVRMTTVIDLDEDDADSKVKIVDNQYAVIVNGEFSSKNIVVDAVNINPRAITSSYTTLLPSVALGIESFSLEIPSTANGSFNYSYDYVSESISSMERVGVDWQLSVTLSLDKLRKRIDSFTLHDFVMTMPKGLTGTPSVGNYDSVNGTITIDKTTVSGNELTISMPVTAIDIAKAGVQFSAENHTLNFGSDIGIKSGTVDIITKQNYSSTGSLDLEVAPSMGFLRIKTFTGVINYSINGLNVPDVSLTDLPGMLTQTETDIRLVNPQILLSIDNPLSEYGVSGTTGLAMTPVRNGVAGSVCKPDANGTINIGVNGASGAYNLVLAPTMPTTVYGNLQDVVYQRFTSLSRLLSGNGLPTSIEIEMTDPKIANAHVKDFVLGNIGAVKGSYTFYAPLEFGAGTMITYTKDETNLGDDVKDITIEKMTVKATISNDLPMDVTFEIVPLDSNGNPIDVKIDGAQINAGTKNAQLTVTLTGEIKGLNGIRYTAIATTAAGEVRPLSPSQCITISNATATISGHYDKKL